MTCSVRFFLRKYRVRSSGGPNSSIPSISSSESSPSSGGGGEHGRPTIGVGEGGSSPISISSNGERRGRVDFRGDRRFVGDVPNKGSGFEGVGSGLEESSLDRKS